LRTTAGETPLTVDEILCRSFIMNRAHDAVKLRRADNQGAE
jgi:hypothetical protein